MFSLRLLYLRMLRRGLWLKSTILLLLFLVKVLKQLVNKRVADHLKKCDLPNFQCGFKSSRSTADLLTVLYDGIVSAFNRTGAMRIVALNISKAFDWT